MTHVKVPNIDLMLSVCRAAYVLGRKEYDNRRLNRRECEFTIPKRKFSTKKLYQKLSKTSLDAVRVFHLAPRMVTSAYDMGLYDEHKYRDSELINYETG